MPNARITIWSVLFLPVRLFLAFRSAAAMEHLVESCSLANGIAPRNVHRSAVAASLSRFIYQIGDDLEMNDGDTAFLESHGFYDAIHYVDEIDSVLAARYEDDYCILSFRGTTANIRDALSNLDVDHIEYSSTQDSYDNNTTSITNPTCYLHEGYHNAYTDFVYKNQLEEYLEICTVECPTCEVILTGHSKGGSVAEIAALFMKEEIFGGDNITESPPPHVITFGAPQSMGAGCLRSFSEEERCRWYHYIMATGNLIGSAIVYDSVPINYANIFVNGRYSKPGHSIIVSSRDTTSSYYTGSDGNYTINFKTLPTDFTGGAHRKQLYMDVLNELSDNYAGGSTPLQTNGFSLGSLCDRDQDLCGDGLECKRVDYLDRKETCRAKPSDKGVVLVGTKTLPKVLQGLAIIACVALLVGAWFVGRRRDKDGVAGNPETAVATTTTGTTAGNNNSNDDKGSNSGSKDVETPASSTATPVEQTTTIEDNPSPGITLA